MHKEPEGNSIVIHQQQETTFRDKLFQTTRMIILVLAVYALATAYTEKVFEKCDMGLWAVILARIIYTFAGLINAHQCIEAFDENLLALVPYVYLFFALVFMSLEFVYGARAMFSHPCNEALTQATMFNTPLLAVIIWMFGFFDIYTVMQNMGKISMSLLGYS